MPIFVEDAPSGRPVCPDCGQTIGGYVYGKRICGEHTSIVEQPTAEQCDECGEPFLPAWGLVNMSNTNTFWHPAKPSCLCLIKEKK